MKQPTAPALKLPIGPSFELNSAAPTQSVVTNESQKLQIELLETQLRLLETRDFAIGAAARTGEMQLQLDAATAANRDLKVHIENHLAHIERLKTALTARSAQLDLVHASTTWRIGRVMMLPVRMIRRVLKRS